MKKKRNPPKALFPDLSDTSASEKSEKEKGEKEKEKEEKQLSELPSFCRKTSDESGNYRFIRDDGEEVCYTTAHHGADPCRLSASDAAEILRLLMPLLSEKRREAKN